MDAPSAPVRSLLTILSKDTSSHLTGQFQMDNVATVVGAVAVAEAEARPDHAAVIPVTMVATVTEDEIADMVVTTIVTDSNRVIRK